VTLGIGAASLSGAGVAQAEDGSSDSSSPSAGNDGRESSSEQTSSTTQAAAKDSGSDASSSDSTSRGAVKGPTAKVGDGRNAVPKGPPKTSPKKTPTGANTDAESSDDESTRVVASEIAETKTETKIAITPAAKTGTTPPTGKHRVPTEPAARSSPPKTKSPQTSLTQNDVEATATTAESPAASVKSQEIAVVEPETIEATAPASSPTPVISAARFAPASIAPVAVAANTPVVAVKTQAVRTTSATSTATVAAATPSAQQRVAPKQAAVPTDPIQSTINWVVRTFFNRTPTVSFAPGATTTLQNGTITGVIRGADADGDVVTYTAGPTTNGGTVAISSDGAFVYTPGAKFSSTGIDTFLVTASDEAAANGWHIHGLLGLLVRGWGSTATTQVSVVGRVTTPTNPTNPNPPTTPTPTPPTGNPPTGATSAAVVYGWGQPDATLSDEFNGTGKPSASWGLYNSAGHAGNGLRRPDQITVQDGYLQIAGTSNGTSGGMMGAAVNPAYGRWEVSMRADKQGAGNPYHAVVALIPYGVPYDNGAGDLDFAEADVDEGRVNVFIHHPANKQTSASTPLDLAEWHTYSIEVAPDHISWFVDGKITMTTTNPAAITGRRWTMNLQLDANDPSGLAPSNMQVGYYRYYPIPPSGAPIIPGPAGTIGNYP
jgi:hypothetical protein